MSSVAQQNQSSNIVLALPNVTVRACNEPHVHCNSIKDKKGPCVPLSPNVPLTDRQASAHLLHGPGQVQISLQSDAETAPRICPQA